MSKPNELKPHTNANPIFIVGSPRSGTTLLSAILSGHSNLSCGPETHFFSKLTQGAMESALTDEKWPELAVKCLESLSLSGQSVHKLFGLSRESLSKYLAKQKPSITSMLEALCLTHASNENKTRWVEKTPNHILYLDKIRELYPNAQIIRIMRDPRDSVLSMEKLPWTSNSYIANSYLWMEWYERSSNFLESDPLSINIKYEDIMQNTTQTLTAVCDFIGEEFEQQMLDTEDTGTKVGSAGEPWKEQVSKPLDKSRMQVWKRDLSLDLQVFSAFFFSDPLKNFYYEGALPPKALLPFYPTTINAIIQNETEILAATSSGIRLVPASDPLQTGQLVYLSFKRKSHNVTALLSTTKLLIKRKIKGKRSYYIDNYALPASLLSRIHLVIVRMIAQKLNLAEINNKAIIN